ncbi:MAG: helix-turn-helix domain-containing protein [Oceanospirillales bacterium]|uniref:histidine kinase n=1 Tax=Marinobacterium halophilum TaxID=267374 RepID=A0A2P8F546_9GAMM|nr:helix-turn-helix domain-containing protein [Marinobacterium halophilum]MBR9828164.1 helix-turn-helix domain-containing protein [Oceanospirillales bacterium]PSL16833.1 PAS domain S-box-containing protein [Marinobacterium halophilum]
MSADGFGKRLLALLKERKTSQIKVAQGLEVSRTAVNKWTKGGMIDDGNLDKLAAFLGVDKIWLKYGDYGNGAQDSGQDGRNINEVHLQETAEIVTWEWDLLTGAVSYSDNVEAVYGVRLTSNEDFWNLMSGPSKDKLVKGYEKIMREGGAHEMDFKINKDGQHRWITSRATGVKGPNGKVTKLIGISLDNTERKTVELRLSRINRFFNTLLAHMDHLVVFTDTAGEILATNHETRPEKISYMELQALLYQFMLKQADQVAMLREQGPCRITFQHKKMVVSHHADDETQPFLMFHFK